MSVCVDAEALASAPEQTHRTRPADARGYVAHNPPSPAPLQNHRHHRRPPLQPLTSMERQRDKDYNGCQSTHL